MVGLERIVALGFRERLAVQRHGVLRARLDAGQVCEDGCPLDCPALPRRAPARAGRSRGRCRRRRGACRRRRAGAAARPRRPTAGVSLSACSASSAAAAGAPRACADRAASSRTEATSPSGSAVASARCRARSSAVGDDRREPGVQRPSARRASGVRRRREPSSGWVKRRRSPSSSRIRAASASASPASARRPTAASTSGRSDRRAPRRRARPLERAALRPSRRDAQELVEVGRDRELLAGSERAASALQRAGKLEREEGIAARGLPEPDQGRPRERRVEVGRAAARGARRRSGRRSRSSAVVLGHGATKPGRQAATDRQQRGDRLTLEAVRARSEAPRPTPRPATGRRPPRGRAGRSAASSAQRSEERGGHRAVVGVDLRLTRAAMRPRAPAAGSAAARARRLRRHRRGDRPAPRRQTGSRPPRAGTT